MMTPTSVIATTNHMDDYASVFLLAQGLRARLVKKGAGGEGSSGGVKDGEAGIASSAALAMLLAPGDTQKEVLEILCPKSGGVAAAAAAGAGSTGLAWGDASAMLLPLWVRDASELQRVAESVASTTFLQDRDLMAVRRLALAELCRRATGNSLDVFSLPLEPGCSLPYSRRGGCVIPGGEGCLDCRFVRGSCRRLSSVVYRRRGRR